MIQKVLTSATIAAAAFGSSGYTQETPSNSPTCGDIDSADADALDAYGSSLTVRGRAILRTFDESLAEEGIAFPIAEARFDNSELDREDRPTTKSSAETIAGKTTGDSYRLSPSSPVLQKTAILQ